MPIMRIWSAYVINKFKTSSGNMWLAIQCIASLFNYNPQLIHLVLRFYPIIDRVDNDILWNLDVPT